MIDIQIVREQPDLVKESQRRRGHSPRIVDDIITADIEWRNLLQGVEKLKGLRNKTVAEIAELKKTGKGVAVKLKESKRIAEKIKDGDEKLAKLRAKRDKLLMELPNILHESVPIGKDDSENVEIKKWGKKPQFNFEPKGHTEIAENLGILDMKNAAKISGARFFISKSELVILDLALQRLAVDHMVEKGFVPILPPFMINRKAYEGVTSLADFEDVLYKIEGEDLYLIATSEHPMIAMFSGEIFEPSQFPIKLVGVSPCFRKEAGTHGKDTKGIFRTHQFNKVEQIVLCQPEDSWAWHEKLLRNTEELMQKLDLPYRVVNVCTGDLGGFAAKKYDIEVWMPVQGVYREIASCSNMTDYQANRLRIKFTDKIKKYSVHTLNNTVIATGRTMVAILENFQQKDGTIKIPKVLWDYTGFKTIGKKK